MCNNRGRCSSFVFRFHSDDMMSEITIRTSRFGYLKTGEEIQKYTLSTRDGFQVSLIEYGATIQSIRQANRENHFAEITLGYETLAEYENDRYFFGCTVGRVTNRIKNGSFELDGQIYQLEKNENGKHHLHGVFHQKRWQSSIEDEQTIVFRYSSPDGEDGFPGDVDVMVTYRLEKDHRLLIDFHAETKNKATPINLTNHTYFNLSDDENESICDHFLQIDANRYTPFDVEHIPTGQIVSVEQTPNDFRQLTRIGERLNEMKNGFNVQYLIDGEGFRRICRLIHRRTGRALTVESTQKALQFYSGTYLDDVRGHHGRIYKKYAGLCLETQNLTDSVNNQPIFPNTILRPGEIYHEQTSFYFHSVYKEF